MDNISPIRRAGLIGDVHGEPERLAAALEYLAGLSLDCTLCTGDIVTGPGDVNRCVRLLEAARATTVRGNHDRWMLDGRTVHHTRATDPATVDASSWHYLKSLPTSCEIETCRGPSLLCHGIGDNDMATLRTSDYGYALESNTALIAITAHSRCKIVVAGHSHQRMVREVADITFINAGTLRFDNEPVFAQVDFEEGYVQFYLIDDPLRIEKAERVSLPR